MAIGIGEPRKGERQTSRAFQREAQMPSLGKIALRYCVHCVGAAHAALPGHGRATADKCATSTRVYVAEVVMLRCSSISAICFIGVPALISRLPRV